MGNGVNFPADRALDFVSIGRLCIDLNANEIHRPLEETVTFTRYLGGSPANITVALARLGAKTGFIGKIANDGFGRFIRRYLEETGIDATSVVDDATGAVTGLAFTEIKSPTDCSILMYRDNVADLKLEPGEVSESLIASAKALVVSGTALAASPSREAVFAAIGYARKHGAKIIYDIDYRPYTWANRDEIQVYCALAAEQADVIFGGIEEFSLLEPKTDAPFDEAAVAARWLGRKAQLVVVKRGGDGSVAYTADGSAYPGRTFPANVVKTFGAGDSFAGAFLYGLLQGWDVPRCQDYGAAAAHIVVSSHSCSDAMPTRAQVEDVLRSVGALEA
ncbi:5-dehydro-2-deoxygluconokinase [Paenibacillus glycinis]|uniref:5-dehydro-2-deoxygluconokinase n=1 Tax=Paenibacillus glycinis TaxID=2697035 RepID=A0ABW9XRM5_9BACL|nr:5-dehydro-2-deoxygluconokinase [Paenibacillus glycinis]NBD25285.1 5-dehydro-2-deoxygluconokinase [Paenibacillus glycinis]